MHNIYKAYISYLMHHEGKCKARQNPADWIKDNIY